MKLWANYMAGFLEKGIMPKNTYGDWCVPPESPQLIHSKDPNRQTSGELLSTAYYYHDLKLLSRSATLLGKAEDVNNFDTLADTVKTAFNSRFFDSNTCRYGNGSQTSYVLPLAFGMVSGQYKDRVFRNLIDKIETQNKGHIGTGLIGGQWLMRVLSDNGRADIAYTIASQKTYPSWGYMISKGATTIWELWNGDTGDPGMNSGNHVMLVGDLNIWLHEYIAGIRPASPGFKQITIKPYVIGDLTWAKATHNSLYGPISSSWKRDKDVFMLDVTIPANTMARIYLPCNNLESVYENGKPVKKAKGVTAARTENGRVVVELGSGDYRFESPLNIE
jgi:alpha-L-rhamnosidase